MNIFQKLFGSKRREKKGKPVPVTPPAPKPVPKADPPIRVATYNRIAVERPPVQQYPKRSRQQREEAEIMFADVTPFSPEWYFMNTEPETVCEAPERGSGYDGYTQTVPDAYVAPTYSYEAPASTTSYDYGSTSSSSGSSWVSSSNSSDSGGGYSSSSSSDSGSSGGGYSGD